MCRKEPGALRDSRSTSLHLETEIQPPVRRHVFNEMVGIIQSTYGTTDNQTLVNMVHEFYCNEIQRYYNYPDWSERSIWEHIHMHMQSEHVQTSEAIQTMTMAMEHLRNAGMCTRDGERVSLDHKATRLYLELVKSRDAIINSKFKRKSV